MSITKQTRARFAPKKNVVLNLSPEILKSSIYEEIDRLFTEAPSNADIKPPVIDTSVVDGVFAIKIDDKDDVDEDADDDAHSVVVSVADSPRTSATNSLTTTPTRKSPRRSKCVANVNLVEQKFEDPRKIISALLADILMKYSSFSSTVEDKRARIIRHLERSCYTRVITLCEHEFINRRWTDKIFVERYNTECFRIMSNLDNNEELIKKIISGTIDPLNISNISSYELNPQSSEKERDFIKMRLDQKLDVKVSDKYKCVKCDARKVQYREFQKRALDEASSFMMECMECRHRWIK